MALVLSILAAAAFGVGDFLGGLASRRSAAVLVTVIASASGLMVGLVAATLVDGEAIGSDLAIGAVAGAAGAFGLLLLYRWLATGPVRVVATMSSVGAAILPLGAGLAFGERPGALGLSGVALAVVAIPLVTFEPDDPARTPGATFAAAVGGALSGVGFGLFFVILDFTSPDSGLWPLVGARTANLVLLGGLAIRAREELRRIASWRTAVAAGFFDMAANIAFLLAVRTGLLSLVAVVSALYPIFTMLLARIYLRERFTPIQIVGIGTALAGTALIAV